MNRSRFDLSEKPDRQKEKPALIQHWLNCGI